MTTYKSLVIPETCTESPIIRGRGSAATSPCSFGEEFFHDSRGTESRGRCWRRTGGRSGFSTSGFPQRLRGRNEGRNMHTRTSWPPPPGVVSTSMRERPHTTIVISTTTATVVPSSVSIRRLALPAPPAPWLLSRTRAVSRLSAAAAAAWAVNRRSVCSVRLLSLVVTVTFSRKVLWREMYLSVSTRAPDTHPTRRRDCVVSRRRE